MITRRGFVKVLSGLIAAPAVVNADSLMKIVAPYDPFLVQPTKIIVPSNGAINLSAIRELLMPGLRDIKRQYEMVPEFYPLVFQEQPK